MSNTDKTTVVASFIKSLLLDNKYTLGLTDVFYGNHNMIPRGPVVMLRPGIKDRNLKGVSAPGGRVQNLLTVLIDVMQADPLSGEEKARAFLDDLAESVETLVHADTTLGGLVIHGFVHRWDPGEVYINDTMWRTVRLTHISESRTYLSA